MKVGIYCLDCLRENGLPNFRPLVVTVNDERFFEMTCSNGHQTLTIIQEPKHEILFELGMNALADGYPREAVNSFASCMENFYGFCINQVSLYKGVDRAALDAGWKYMAKQSERQLGAFVMLWLNYFGSAPKLLSEASRSFRNRVVHQGYIPRLDETLAFGDDIVACVASNLHDMKHHLDDDLDTIFISEFSARAFSQNQRVTTQSIPTTIGWAGLIQNEKVDLRARLIAIDKDKVTFQWPKF
ncbi:hypothetical protein [Tabrizicola fusiformis]|uniref:hypothetical protein n=1 Tax=Tabrizicola sp. SY72 TaxID=2741673 RepID=UPI00157302D8|nr:hypothetical protein [Tabrizicola sp. SY72]NTT87879.1 hypothetical protein [Tabrizicola sp. SY72]